MLLVAIFCLLLYHNATLFQELAIINGLAMKYVILWNLRHPDFQNDFVIETPTVFVLMKLRISFDLRISSIESILLTSILNHHSVLSTFLMITGIGTILRWIWRCLVFVVPTAYFIAGDSQMKMKGRSRKTNILR
ncbi:hypothetical protein BVRB_5g104670 [Beta vulgaris subsp. vulgaris]|nr:hypothetical protein BVRB_5g104670 [Beta vulgaris subsp. vulgaris]